MTGRKTPSYLLTVAIIVVVVVVVVAIVSVVFVIIIIIISKRRIPSRPDITALVDWA